MPIDTDDSTPGQPRSRQTLIAGDVTGQIIGAFYDVYNVLGHGFLESVYKAALEIEFRKRGLSYVREGKLTVFYRESIVGVYKADFFVEERVVVEVKSSRAVGETDREQLLHYLGEPK